jgi:signal transduction histidine kinase
MAEAAGEALRRAGHETAACLSISEAVSRCQERRPDLVVSEYYIQDGTGLEFLEKLAKLDRRPPVLVASGCGHEEAAARVMRAGAWSYQVKTEEYLKALPLWAEEALSAWDEKKREREEELVRRRQEAQSELAGWLAHNFKNILAASIGYINLIDFSNPNQDRARQQEYLTESRKSQESAIHLLEQLIRMTDSAQGEPERVVLAEVIDAAWETAKAKVLSNFQHQYPERLSEVQAKIPQVAFINSARLIPPQQLVRADLSSIMEALLQNALEAVLNTGEARVLAGAELRGKRLEIEIKDNGRGMDENVLRHATEPLFSTKGEVGVGLSLSLVSSLVMRHGGALTLRSIPGGGVSAAIVYEL